MLIKNKNRGQSSAVKASTKLARISTAGLCPENPGDYKISVIPRLHFVDTDKEIIPFIGDSLRGNRRFPP
jgi:hypothetical protein